MGDREAKYCTAFEGHRRIASGELAEVALATRKVIERGHRGPVLIFDDLTSEQVEVDLRGSDKDVLRRLGPAKSVEDTGEAEEGVGDAGALAPRGPGRPRLGVVAREVTLLPRHWEWLGTQPGGASVALRKLVEAARKDGEGRDRLRRAQESAYRFMSAMGGDLVGFEEATRALFSGNQKRFGELVKGWPKDVSRHAMMLAERVFAGVAREGVGSEMSSGS